jgi:hypothetical protein
MSFHDFMRFFAGACAVVVAIFLVRGIVIGRWQLGQRSVTRAEDAKTYWLLVARHSCTLVGLALVATIVRERLFAPVLFLFLFAPTLAFALVTGRFEWEADDRRIDSPRRFRGWVTFYAGLIALWVVVLFMEVFKAS